MNETVDEQVGTIHPVADDRLGRKQLLSVDNIFKRFHGGEQPVDALRGVSLDVGAGEFLAVMGASGSGKSTLLHLIAGLDRPDSGFMVVEGHDLARMDDRARTLFRRRRLGIIFQSYNLLPTLSALENVALPALLDGRNSREADRAARELLERVDLMHRVAHRPQALSGGEQQRVAIARALMNEPILLLADEPTGNLDTAHGAQIWRLLRSLAREGHRSVIAVTHEADGAAHADRVVVLKDGRSKGEFHPGQKHDVALVAARYRELVA